MAELKKLRGGLEERARQQRWAGGGVTRKEGLGHGRRVSDARASQICLAARKGMGKILPGAGMIASRAGPASAKVVDQVAPRHPLARSLKPIGGLPTWRPGPTLVGKPLSLRINGGN
jgi:hypothetical protein